MKIRFIIRDGKKILQSHPGKFGDWTDVPLVEDDQEKALRVDFDFRDPGPLPISERKVVWYETQQEKVSTSIPWTAPVAGDYLVDNHEIKLNKGDTIRRDSSGVWVDQTAPTEPTEQDFEDLESGEYRMGLRTVTFSRCIHNDPTCHCRES